jgi:peptidoglycan hydrolase-like protein with peptidoglycan-binding domain
MRVAALLAVAVGAVVASGAQASAARATHATPPRATVYFLQGEQLSAVRRAGSRAPLRTSVQALLRGPAAAEWGRGLRNAVPAGTRLLGVDLDGTVATVDVSRGFLSRSDTALAGIAQLVYTATGVRGVGSVWIRIDGRPLAAIPGARLSLDRPLDRAALRPLRYEPPEVPTDGPLARSEVVEDIQGELVRLGYLPRGSVDGVYGRQTRHAILAFQGWNRRRRDGRASRSLQSALEDAEPPRPARGWARHIEVELARQVALFVDRGRVVRVVHVSTGARGFETPRGRFSVFRKELRPGRTRIGSGCRTRVTSRAGSRSTSQPTCRATPRRTGASECRRTTRGGCTPSRASAHGSTSSRPSVPGRWVVYPAAADHGRDHAHRCELVARQLERVAV